MGSAKVLESNDVRRLLKHARGHRHAIRDRVIILLSFKAGLRAAEIAGLTWPMVIRPNGRVSDELAIAASIAKCGSARRIPLNDELRAVLLSLHMALGHPKVGPVIISERKRHMTARSIVNWFAALYADVGLHGCSSHSGRRTFITRSARLLATSGGSLRDVQELAGHRALTTTERYIQGSREAQRKLVKLV